MERRNENGNAQNYFFSIIIPAHNEEKYIQGTLSRVRELLCPKDFFEVVVIENGSTDNTLKLAEAFTSDNTHIFHSPEKGVPKAKNLGLEKISSKSDWVIFLDADTRLEATFLRDLNTHLKKHASDNFIIGTTAVRPMENKNWYARWWFWAYNIGHRFTKTSYAIQIMKASLLGNVRFDKTLALAEDLQFIQDCLLFGKFFYFSTDTVLTSTRRFDTVGWGRQFIEWNWDALVWKFRKTKKEYPVIR